MPTVEIRADVAALEDLAADLEKAKRQLIGRMAERGYQLLRQEVPHETGNLKDGVAAPKVDYEQMTASLTVSARSARLGPRSAVIYDKEGKERKRVTLKPQPAFNYAEVVALGRKAFKAKGARLGPKGEKPVGPGFASVLIIPVRTAPSDEGYLIAGGQVYVFRRSAKAVPANPYHDRAAKRLESEAERIATKVLERFI